MITGQIDVVEMAQHPFFTRMLGKYAQKPRRAAFIAQANRCFEWQGALNSKGYGCDGGGLLHRQAWELVVGPIPPDHEIHHVCKNKLCSRIDHLALVTHSEHMAVERRTILSEFAVRSILTELQEGETPTSLGAKYGVTASHISKIKNGKRWMAISLPFWVEHLQLANGVHSASVLASSSGT